MAPMKSPVHRKRHGELKLTWSLAHLARRWQTPRRVVRSLLVQRKLPFEEINGEIRIPVKAIRAFEISFGKIHGKSPASER